MDVLETLSRLTADPTYREELLQQSEWPAEVFSTLYSGVEFVAPSNNTSQWFYHRCRASAMVTAHFLKSQAVVLPVTYYGGIIRKVEPMVFQAEILSVDCQRGDHPLTEKLITEAIRAKPRLIVHIQDPSPELQRVAVSQNLMIFKAIKKPTEEVCERVLSESPLWIKHMEQTEALCIKALSRYCHSLKWEDIKIHTPAIDLLLIQRYPSFFETLEDPTEEQIVAYLGQKPKNVHKWTHRPEVVLKAIREEPVVAIHLPKEHVTDEIRELVLAKDPYKITHPIFGEEERWIKKVLCKRPHMLEYVEDKVGTLSFPFLKELAQTVPEIVSYYRKPFSEEEKAQLLEANPAIINYLLSIDVNQLLEFYEAHPEVVPQELPLGGREVGHRKILCHKYPHLIPQHAPFWCTDNEYHEMIVRKHPREIIHWGQAPKQLWEVAVKKCPDIASRCPHNEVILQVLAQDGLLLKDFTSPNQEMCLTAVKQNPEAIVDVPREHLGVCQEAIRT